MAAAAAATAVPAGRLRGRGLAALLEAQFQTRGTLPTRGALSFLVLCEAETALYAAVPLLAERVSITDAVLPVWVLARPAIMPPAVRMTADLCAGHIVEGAWRRCVCEGALADQVDAPEFHSEDEAEDAEPAAKRPAVAALSLLGEACASTGLPVVYYARDASVSRASLTLFTVQEAQAIMHKIGDGRWNDARGAPRAFFEPSTGRVLPGVDAKSLGDALWLQAVRCLSSLLQRSQMATALSRGATTTNAPPWALQHVSVPRWPAKCPVREALLAIAPKNQSNRASLAVRLCFWFAWNMASRQRATVWPHWPFAAFVATLDTDRELSELLDLVAECDDQLSAKGFRAAAAQMDRLCQLVRVGGIDTHPVPDAAEPPVPAWCVRLCERSGVWFALGRLWSVRATFGVPSAAELLVQWVVEQTGGDEPTVHLQVAEWAAREQLVTQLDEALKLCEPAWCLNVVCVTPGDLALLRVALASYRRLAPLVQPGVLEVLHAHSAARQMCPDLLFVWGLHNLRTAAEEAALLALLQHRRGRQATFLCGDGWLARPLAGTVWGALGRLLPPGAVEAGDTPSTISCSPLKERFRRLRDGEVPPPGGREVVEDPLSPAWVGTLEAFAGSPLVLRTRAEEPSAWSRYAVEVHTPCAPVFYKPL